MGAPTDLAPLMENCGDGAVLCCGPDGFRAMVREYLNSRCDFPMSRYFEESFAGAPARNPAISTYSVRFARSGKVLSGNGAVTILQLARAAGIAIESSCETGLCGSCRSGAISGQWRRAAHCIDAARSVLTAEEISAGVVLACTTCPEGQVVIDL